MLGKMIQFTAVDNILSSFIFARTHLHLCLELLGSEVILIEVLMDGRRETVAEALMSH